MEDFKLNDRVLVIGKNTKGKIAFIGDTHFAKGKLFGIILDEPKGKYSGSIDSVCYFECPKNYATFVRACQLQKDNCSLSNRSAPTYPNYLKGSSSKHGFKTIILKSSASKSVNSLATEMKPIKSPKNDLLGKLKYDKYEKGDITMDEADIMKTNSSCQKDEKCSLKDYNFKHAFKIIRESGSKSEIRNPPNTKKMPIKSPKQDQTKQLQYEKCQEGDTTIDTKMQSVREAQLSVLKQNLAERNKKMNAVYGDMIKLQTYLKWSKEMKKNTKDNDNRTNDFFKLQVDSVLKKMEDIVGHTSNKKPANFVDGSPFSEENYFLHLYVDVLEKKNEVLADSLTHVKNILERAWNRSDSKKQFKLVGNPKTSDGQVEKRYKDCLPKRQSLTDEFEHETLLFLESNEVNNVKAMAPTNLKDLQVLTGSDKVKRYLESLLPNKDILSRTDSEINNKMKNENYNIAVQQQIPTKDNTGSQVFSQSSDSSLKFKSSSNNNNGEAINKVRSISQSRKQSHEKNDLKNVPDPTKELQEFISEIVSRVSNKNKSMDSCPTEDSSITISPNKTLKEQKKKEVKSNLFVGCASHSNILQMKKPASSECEKNVKRSRAASTGRIHKREISK